MEEQSFRQMLVDGLLIRYRWWPAAGGKPVLVFLHGWRSAGSVWFSNVKSFIRDNPVLVVNLPGFGGSDSPKKNWGLSDYAHFVHQVLAKLDIKKTILIGHSFGGAVAVKLTTIIPDQVRGLVLVDTSGVRAKNLRVQLYKIGAKLVGPVFRLQAFTSIRNNIYKTLGFEDYVATPYLTGSYRNIIAEDLRPTLDKITCPALLIWGDKDKDTPLAQAHIIKNRLKNSTLEVIPGAGHFVFLDKPELFNRNLDNFIKNL
jgi:pimeloyl-ACP methyl ester carboxylesterase